MTEEGAIGPLMMGMGFPEMSVRTTHGKIELPGHFKGQWFILFSHPADFTPICTTEFVEFQHRRQEFRELGCELIGHSVDLVIVHLKWIEWIEENLGVRIEFPIIADGKALIARRLGVLHPVKGMGAVRAVFIVDDEGVIRLILYYPQHIGRNTDELLRIIKAMRVAEAHGVAMPANWPNSSLIGDEVLLEPPMTEEEMRERKELGCKDWWFCHRKVDY